MVVLHTIYNSAQAFGAPTLVAFDVFRVEDGKVAEHWDNLQAPGAPNPSGYTMTDGATEITDFISTETYIQHNPNTGDGLGELFLCLTRRNRRVRTIILDDLAAKPYDGWPWWAPNGIAVIPYCRH